MINIIRIQTQEQPEQLWDRILDKKDELQSALANNGKILYLSKRSKYNEASMFVHTRDTNVLGDFIAMHLAKLDGVTGIWVINMVKPIFFPLPKGAASQMKRYTVTVKSFPPRLSEIYEKISQLVFPDGIKITYLAYTFHLFGDCLQFSLLADEEKTLQKYVNDIISNIPGILRTTVCEIEKNFPFISFEDWQNYSSQNPLLAAWDQENMIAQFQP
jgi:hypothetical protein